MWIDGMLFLIKQTTEDNNRQNKIRNVCLFIHLHYNGDMKADGDGAR